MYFPGFALSIDCPVKDIRFGVLWEALVGGLPGPDSVWPCSQLPFIMNSSSTSSCISNSIEFPLFTLHHFFWMEWGKNTSGMKGINAQKSFRQIQVLGSKVDTDGVLTGPWAGFSGFSTGRSESVGKPRS